MTTMVPVVLCGGSGTRLWPRSRTARPKPFIPLVDDTPLFCKTLERCSDPDLFTTPVVVTNEAQLDLVEQQSCGTEVRIIVEPTARNTGPAIALAAFSLPADAVMLVCPSDHHIEDTQAFIAAARKAAELAAQGWLVTFGIAATHPETGFGYLRQGKPIGDLGYQVERFIEKPDVGTARELLATGQYSWNGGIFAFRAGTFVDELVSHRPEMAIAVEEAIRSGQTDGQRFFPDANSFADVQGESVDHAVMENTRAAAMVPATMGWSDIGNWHALRAVRTADGDGNVQRGKVELVDCRNVMVDTDGPSVSVIGLDDVIVVVDGNDILVTTALGAQKVGHLRGVER
ncbi:mannose-1-phosphate guanylyltransferase [Croceicoccus sp. F390]|uniref:Mannose-1-phosphate guanylyltransferase n=1 Tax=Croceicoccus esteveae TaxID=3075597 RepID=A0ABU2ZMJ8_9SPHN|nr:mannose-1-phosphate guanylyltransferase [Croceicoccus sp. F390]MDT0576809.1 mannose-1-phosphate guanylyltransferase [Croceicoccus sp. F390]